MYQGPIAGGQPIPDSPVRQISDASPVKGANNKAMTCGPDAKPVSFVAPANPGSAIDVLWQANDRNHWPHNTGPMEVYLASCGSVPCDKFDASNAQWFKISEVGKRNGGWVQQDQFDGKAHSFKLPSNLARGGYLLRHEIVALHLADQPGGAEFYPACIQINVGGNQSGAPSPNELVRFPGAYKDNDPGILVNAFTDAPYKFPGPAISKLASSSNNDAGSPSPSPAPSSKTEGPAQPSPSVVPPKNGSGNCKPKKKRAVYNYSNDYIPSIPASALEPLLDDFKPRHISRVMARMVKPHFH
ncbi:hypothetical protein BDM02DRAFT_3119271 [Thelephora ganbajun]|uniref:Uncharacterized protein n=1 Tax=Thelephora ganbajun TaxID=370292 RepID=A0ACB6ZA79_THEGA|nr:hypothetical protein BDM02DRAFT_3119271 [Thelephora ganbajun]